MYEQLRCLRDEHGWDVTAVVSGDEGPLVDLLRQNGIPFHVEKGFFFLNNVTSTLGMFGLVWRLARFFRKSRFDVVQSHLLFAMLPTRFAAWLADTPVRLAMYPSPYHLDAPITLRMDRFSWWMENRLIASCRYTYDLLRKNGVDESRLTTIYYGVDESRYDPEAISPIDLAREFGWPHSTPVIVKVAYFYPRQPSGEWTPKVVQGRNTKAFEDLIEAMPLVLTSHPEAKLLLVGGAWGEAGVAYLDEMKELVRRRGLGESVVFTGFRKDVNAILRNADIAVQAAIYENVGGVVESLLMARPTVATAVGGIVDCVIDGETGVLVNPSDPEDMARGINSLLADPALAARLAANGRRLMLENFTLAKTCRDLDGLYRTLAQQAQRRHYSLPVSSARWLAGFPLLLWFVAKVAFRDFYLPAQWPMHRQRLRDVLAMPFVTDIYLRRLLARGGEPPLPPSILWANRKVTTRLRVEMWLREFPTFYRMAHWPMHRQRLRDILAMPFIADVYLRRLLARASPRYTPDAEPALPPSIRWANRKVTARLTLERWLIEFPMHCKARRDLMVYLAARLQSRLASMSLICRIRRIMRHLA